MEARIKMTEHQGYYTSEEYFSWTDDERWEIINGVPYAMATPSFRHQRIARKLGRQFEDFLEGKTCEAFSLPIDVQLNADEADDTIVQPDITVICDKSKLVEGRGYRGVPAMVVEILSPSTSRKDRTVKFEAYRKAGVPEYWIVDPVSKTVQVFLLADGEYVPEIYDSTALVPVKVLEGCEINLASVFVE